MDADDHSADSPPHDGPGGDSDDPWTEASSLERAVAALRAVALHTPAAELADRICAAVTQLLTCDGSSLSALYTSTMSVPVGASDPAAAAAEQIQFTAGEGPCIRAHHTGTPQLLADVVDPVDQGRRRWPTYALLLMRASAYRSVLAVPVPLTAASGVDGYQATKVPLVLTCYRRDPVGTTSAPATTNTGNGLTDLPEAVRDAVGAAEVISAALGAVLAEISTASPGVDTEWLDSHTALRRATVWQAEEQLLHANPLLSREAALAALRTYAVIHSKSVDQAAIALLEGHLTAEEALGWR